MTLTHLLLGAILLALIELRWRGLLVRLPVFAGLAVGGTAGLTVLFYGPHPPVWWPADLNDVWKACGLGMLGLVALTIVLAGLWDTEEKSAARTASVRRPSSSGSPPKP
jgi:hypothetical protein